MSEQLTPENVREMAKLAVMSGKINEIQAYNLKMFPFGCFDGVKSVRVDYDLSNNRLNDGSMEPNDHRVTYYLDMKEALDLAILEPRFKYLEACVHNLLWKQINVMIYFGDELVYPGPTKGSNG